MKQEHTHSRPGPCRIPCLKEFLCQTSYRDGDGGDWAEGSPQAWVDGRKLSIFPTIATPSVPWPTQENPFHPERAGRRNHPNRS